MSNFVNTNSNIDFLSIRQVHDVFMTNEIEKWRLFTNNFSKSKGVSAQELERLSILHTNDMHSHIHPINYGRNKGLGGMAERAAKFARFTLALPLLLNS